MPSLLTIALATVQLVAALLLAAFGLHRLRLAVWRLHHRPIRRVPQGSAPRPRVTVQIPLYNERHVAARALRAAGALEYPRDRFEIQVLDDSTDGTSGIVAACIEDLRAEGIAVRHVRRTHRHGYKAGALAHGLTLATGDLIAIFDADFVPGRDFLTRLVPEFADPAVGMVQARWDHLNAGATWLTRVQALQLDAHFAVEHSARWATGCFFSFNGTAGIWRRSAIETSGGWRANALTEDVDLAFRAQLAGWQFVYRDDVGVPGELPDNVPAYRIQQQRWAQGGTETARRILPRLLRAPLPLRVKIDAVSQLTAHAAYPLLLLVMVAGFLLARAGGTLGAWTFHLEAAILAFATLSLGVFYGVAARARTRERSWRRLWLVPLIMLAGAGIAVSQSVAVLRGIMGRPTSFRRTPKYGAAAQDVPARRRFGYRAPAWTPWEWLLAGLLLTAVASGGHTVSGLPVLMAGGLLLLAADAAARGAGQGSVPP